MLDGPARPEAAPPEAHQPTEPATAPLAATGTARVAAPQNLADRIDAATTAAPPPPARQVADALVAGADAMPKHDAKVLHLDLAPKDLGNVEVRITRDAEGRMSAQIVANREAARDALAAGLPELRHTLERVGLTVERLDVSARADNGTTSDGGAGRNAEHSDTRGHRPWIETGGDEPTGSGEFDDRLLSVRA
jgi:flagellar hook-length control protein FliK